MDLKEKLKGALQKALSSLAKLDQLAQLEKITQLEHPSDPNNGDYSSNIALQVQQIGPIGLISPIELAEALREKLLADEKIKNFVERIDVASPGFINFWLSKEELSRQLSLALTEGERYGGSGEGKGKIVVIDYSSPNIAKRFGIGHLRSTIIGQTIYNLYQFLGYRIIGDNHLGDWGTQFGAIIYQITNLTNSPNLSNLSVGDLERLYVEFNKQAHDNPELWEEARKWFKKLEEGDPAARKIWKACVEVSMVEFNRIYKLLGVDFNYSYGESFYEDKMGSVFDELVKKNLAVENQGALIIKYPNEELPPGIIRKSDGATTYLTRDLATVKFRLEKWNPDKILYEVGAEQSLHFRQLFRVAELLEWISQDHLVHVKHGLYLNPDGKKFSTRKGETVDLEEVLKEAIERAGKLGKGDWGDKDDGEKLEVEVSRAVGVGAIKYFDLSHHPESQIVFSWEKMFLLTGNSGPYLQYTYARCRSVLRKFEARNSKHEASSKRLKFKNRISDLESEELALLRTFYRFPEVVQDAAHQYAPNLLCNFLFDLASKYNKLYNNVSILYAENRKQRANSGGTTPFAKRNFRLALTAVTAQILKTGLGLLGIATPERM